MSTTTVQLSTIGIAQLYDLLQPITVPNTSSTDKFANWSQTFACSPLAIFEPETEYHCELILELARREGRVVRAVGVGHSPSDLACTTGYMLRTTKLNRLLEVSIFRLIRLNFVCIPGLNALRHVSLVPSLARVSAQY
jgi:L-gulonolactone oxidase